MVDYLTDSVSQTVSGLKTFNAGILKANDATFINGSAPATPASGLGILYVNSSDKHIYFKNDTGTAFDLTAASTSSVTGTGANTRVTFWTGTSTISSDSNFTYASNNLTVAAGTVVSLGLQTGGFTSIASSGIENQLVSRFASGLTTNITGTAGTQTGNLYTSDIYQATLTATNAQTVPNVASLHIQGAPIASTNMTFTNKYAFWVAGGNSRFDGALFIGTVGPQSSNEQLSINVPASIVGSSSIKSLYQAYNSSTVNIITTANTGGLYGVYEPGFTVTSTPASSTMPIIASHYINSPTASGNASATSGRIYALVLTNNSLIDGGSLLINNRDSFSTTEALRVSISSAAPTTGSSTAKVMRIAGTSSTFGFTTTGQTGNVYGDYFEGFNITSSVAGTVIPIGASVFISGAPTVSGANSPSITNSYALYINTGATYFGGSVEHASTSLFDGAATFSASATFNSTVNILNGQTASASVGEALQAMPSLNIAGSSTTAIGAIRIPTSTLNFTGATAQTGTVAILNVAQVTLTNNTAGTVPDSSSIRVVGPPIAGSGMTLTRPWSLWIDSGNARFDGNLDFSQSDTTDIILGTTTGTKFGTSTSQKLAFYNSTPIVQPTTIQAAITDNTGGSSSTTFSAITAGTLYSQTDMTNVKNALASIATRLNEIRTTLRNLGLSA